MFTSAVWKDPTVLFTVFVVKAPLVFHVMEHGAQVLLSATLNHFLSPTMIASYVYLFLVVKIAHMGNPVKLNDRDKRVALWYLMNGTSFVREPSP